MNTAKSSVGGGEDAMGHPSQIVLQDASEWADTSETEKSAATTALLRSLKFAGVKFIRYASIDACNTIRAKASPIDRIGNSGNGANFDHVVSIPRVCFAGLPSYADFIVPGTNIDGKLVLTLKPDLSTLRILPYASKTAMVMSTAHDQRTGKLSPFCSRGVLHRVKEAAKRQLGIAFSAGVELEFCLYRGGKPVDSSTFANTTTLNEQEGYICDLLDQLKAQDIEVELVHSESASGQLEVVLVYQEDIMKIADNVVFAQETIRAVSKAHGMQAIFLPKINPNEPGNGGHVHFSFRDIKSATPNRNAFPHEENVGEVSAKAGSFMEGILQHLPALLSLTIPSENSFRRVGPGCWTGHSTSWEVEDRDSALRVCLDLDSGEATHVELKVSDLVGNIYLKLASVLLAGMDGIARGLKLRPSAGDSDTAPVSLPRTFTESLGFLKKDTFLTNALGADLMLAYIVLRETEVTQTAGLNLEEEVAGALRKG